MDDKRKIQVEIQNVQTGKIVYSLHDTHEEANKHLLPMLLRHQWMLISYEMIDEGEIDVSNTQD